MIRHNLLITYRNSIRNKSTFIINLLGLSTGLACVLLIYLWVGNELNINKFGKDDNRRLQIMENTENSESIITGPSTPDLLAQALADEIPEVEYAAAVTPSSWFGNFTLANEGNNYKAMGQFAGKDFFNVFPYDLLKGNKEHVLSENNSIVISEQLALKIFHTTDNIIGKPVESQLLSFNMPVAVSGVYKGIPSNSTERFDFVLSYDLWLNILKQLGSPVNWGNHRPDTYVLLKQGADAKEFNNKIEEFIKKKNKNSNVTLFARPYSDNYLYNKYENGILVGGKIEYVKPWRDGRCVQDP